ncbi:MAG: hypothetical protein AAF492_20595, partial [Verrucomicrobiota bacterium]
DNPSASLMKDVKGFRVELIVDEDAYRLEAAGEEGGRRRQMCIEIREVMVHICRIQEVAVIRFGAEYSNFHHLSPGLFVNSDRRGISSLHVYLERFSQQTDYGASLLYTGREAGLCKTLGAAGSGIPRYPFTFPPDIRFFGRLYNDIEH